METNKGIRAFSSIEEQLAHAQKTKNSDMLDQVRSRTTAWLNRLNRLSSEDVDLNIIRNKFKHFYFSELMEHDENVSENIDPDPTSITDQEGKDFNSVTYSRSSLPTKFNSLSLGKGRGRGYLRSSIDKSVIGSLEKPFQIPDNNSKNKSQVIAPQNGSDNLIGQVDTSGQGLDIFRTGAFYNDNQASAYFHNTNQENISNHLLHKNRNEKNDTLFEPSGIFSAQNQNKPNNSVRFQDVLEERENSLAFTCDKPISTNNGGLSSLNVRNVQPHQEFGFISNGNTNHGSRVNRSDNVGLPYDNTPQPRNLSLTENMNRGRDIDEILKILKLGTDRTTPLYKWDARFSGDGEGYSLNEFLKRIERFALDENMSHQKLLANVHRLLDGVARKWYWASLDEWQTWDQFVRSIRTQFLPRNYRFFLQEEIANRLQAHNEPFSSFITDMKILFQKADPPLDEDFKLYIIQKNMLPHYSEPLSTHNVVYLNDLIDLCKRIDENQMMKVRRMASSQFANYPLVEPSCFPPQTVRNRNWTQRPVHVIDNENSLGDILSAGFSQDVPYGQWPQYSNPQIPNQYLSEIILPPQHGKLKQQSTFLCFNCEKPGHTHRSCTQPKTFLYCYLCGLKNCTVDTCPKNHRRTRSSAHQFKQPNQNQFHPVNSSAQSQNFVNKLQFDALCSPTVSPTRKSGNGNMGGGN